MLPNIIVLLLNWVKLLVLVVLLELGKVLLLIRLFVIMILMLELLLLMVITLLMRSKIVRVNRLVLRRKNFLRLWTWRLIIRVTFVQRLVKLIVLKLLNRLMFMILLRVRFMVMIFRLLNGVVILVRVNVNRPLLFVRRRLISVRLLLMKLLVMLTFVLRLKPKKFLIVRRLDVLVLLLFIVLVLLVMLIKLLLLMLEFPLNRVFMMNHQIRVDLIMILILVNPRVKRQCFS